jgi:hypothetical protein
MCFFLLGIPFFFFAQKTNAEWGISFPRDSTILDFVVNSKQQVICIAEDKNYDLFSIVLDKNGKQLYRNLFPLLNEAETGAGEEMDAAAHDKMLITKNDRVYFVGTFKDRFVRIANYVTLADEESEEDYLFIAELDAEGKLKELQCIVKYVYGVDFTVPGFTGSADGSLLMSLTAESSRKKSPHDEHFFYLNNKRYDVSENQYGEYLIRLQQDLSVSWVNALTIDNSSIVDGSGPEDYYPLRNIATDKEGNCYRVLNFNGDVFSEGKPVFETNTGNKEEEAGFVIKYDPAGTVVWSRQLPGVQSFADIMLFGNSLVLYADICSAFKTDGFDFKPKNVAGELLIRISRSTAKINWIGTETALSIHGFEDPGGKHLYTQAEHQLLSFDTKMKATVACSFQPANPLFKLYNGKGYLLNECDLKEITISGKKYSSTRNKLFLVKLDLKP